MLKFILSSLLVFFMVTFSNAGGINVPVLNIDAPNLSKLHMEDVSRDKAGVLYRVGVATSLKVNNYTHGVWSVLPNRDQKWQLTISNSGAESLSFIFEKFVLSGNSKFWVENNKGEKVSKIHTKKDLLPSLQQNIALCKGDLLTFVLLEEAYSDKSEIELGRVFYNYRSTIRKTEKINESASCGINVNCSEGNEYEDEKRGVARIYVVEGNTAGFCSGSLVNNLKADCKPLFLTALHCGVSTSSSDMLLWSFYFNYESEDCSNPNNVGGLMNNYTTGCIRLADSDCAGGDYGSDFLLIQLGTVETETATIEVLKSAGFEAYWNGWDANNTVSSNGVGIHHPAGDIKKVSTYTSSLSSSTWGNSVANTHWSLSWVATQNGHGVTEGGSSGSPLFTFNDGNSRIIGSLTGGASYCDATSDPDSYGKMSFHWSSNGSATNTKASSFLDPLNSGVKFMDGSSNPCMIVGLSEIELKSDFELYPNPSNDILYIKSNKENKISVVVFDMLGNEVLKSESQLGVLQINLEVLLKGVYQVKIVQDNFTTVRSISKI